MQQISILIYLATGKRSSHSEIEAVNYRQLRMLMLQAMQVHMRVFQNLFFSKHVMTW